MSKTTITLAAVVVLAIAAVAFMLQRGADDTAADPTDSPTTIATATSEPTSRSTTSTTTSPSASATVSATTIRYTSSGYQPTSLEVPVGTRVTFINDTNTKMWPASDPHPTHTTLAGFDASKALGQGGSYSFTFTKAGTWRFHDHLTPSQTGTIVVK